MMKVANWNVPSEAIVLTCQVAQLFEALSFHMSTSAFHLWSKPFQPYKQKVLAVGNIRRMMYE